MVVVAVGMADINDVAGNPREHWPLKMDGVEGLTRLSGNMQDETTHGNISTPFIISVRTWVPYV